MRLGVDDGCRLDVGFTEGDVLELGALVGLSVIVRVTMTATGIGDGCVLGLLEGDPVGAVEGLLLSCFDGCGLGFCEGTPTGVAVGCNVPNDGGAVGDDDVGVVGWTLGY